MSRGLDQFEESIRQSLDGVKFDYEPQGWAEMDARLNRAGGSARRTNSLWAAAGFLLLSATAFSLLPGDSSTASLAGRSADIPQAGFGYASTTPLSSDANTSTPFASSTTDQATNTAADQEGSASTSNTAEVDKTFNNTSSETGLDQPSESTPPPSVTDTNAEANLADAAPAPAIMLSVSEACQGEPVSFSVNMDLDGLEYLWIFGDGDFSKESNPTHVFEKSGTWEVGLSIQDSRGKINASSLGAKVHVHQKPEAVFDWDFTNQPGDVTTVKFNNLSKHASDSYWVFDDGHDTGDINPEREYFQRGKKRVKLVTTNEFGCKDTAAEYLYVEKDYDLEAPLALAVSPELTFMPDALEGESRPFKLTVYNDMQPVFTSTNFEHGWDGSLPGGSAVTTGTVCHWVLIICGRGGLEKEYFSGELTISAP